MNRFIIDASVGAKWIFKDEELSEKAALLLELSGKKKIQIVVPELFYSELANACWVNLRKHCVTVEQANKALEKIMNLSIETYSDKELSDVALENALRFQISVYDGIYLALAEIYLTPFVTADQKLLKACQRRFEFIEHLADIEI